MIVSRLMAKRPEDRFSSASEVAELLESCLAHVQQPTSVPLPASLVPHATGRRSIFTVPLIGVIAMFGTIGMTLLGIVLWQATEAPEIAGNWTGEEWGAVVLEAKQPGQYQGSYNGTNPAESGTMQLKWSRVERRFNGTWKAGDDRKGKISLRLVGNEIRGALTTAKNAEKESDSPRLADFEWKRSRPAQEVRVTIQALPGGDVVVLKGTKADVEATQAALSQQFSKKATTILTLPGSDVIVLKGTKADVEAAQAALSQQFSKKPTTTVGGGKGTKADVEATQEEKVSDDEFLRRVYLDWTGGIPTVEETRSFLNDKDPRKRDKLIDRLLESNPEKFLRRVYLDLTGVIPTVEETRSFLNDKDPRKPDKLIDKLLEENPAGKTGESTTWKKWKAVIAQPEAKKATQGGGGFAPASSPDP